ncbi:MAG TPA: COX15/CtaA family protein [Chloroflexota bacterium]|nr:COX15/CtaA family protein [Chloroflexota bacterium]
MRSREGLSNREISAIRVANQRTGDRDGRGNERSARFLWRLGLVTTVAVLILITVGGVVRASGSGLGCPDWPTCHGQVVPPLVLQPILEYSHRFVAGLVSVFVVVFAAYGWLRYRHQRWILGPVSLAVMLLIGEITLGALTVESELRATLVTIHLGTALALFATVVIATAAAYWVVARERRLRVDWYAWLSIGTVALTYVLMLIGSLVTMSTAAYACAAWPLCGSGLQLPVGEPSILNVVHRVVAVVVAIGVLAMVAWVRSARPAETTLRVQVWIGLGLLILQGTVGAGLVLWHIPPFTAVVHLLFAAAFFGNLVATAFLACFPSDQSETAQLQPGW